MCIETKKYCTNWINEQLWTCNGLISSSDVILSQKYLLKANRIHKFNSSPCFPSLLFTYLACILDESPGLLLDAWHVWVGGVDQSGDLCGPHEAVLCQRPAQVQSRGSQVGLHGPVGVWGAISLLTSLMVCKLWDAGGLVGRVDCGLDKFNFWLSQETDHICGLEELIVALVWQETHPNSLHHKTNVYVFLEYFK